MRGARTLKRSDYNPDMRGWSIPLGRWMGVEIRVHAFFPLLAVVCLVLSSSDGVARGLGLFLVLTSAVLVRETARLLVAAWLGLQAARCSAAPHWRTVCLCRPRKPGERQPVARGQFAMALAGPAGKRSYGAGAGFCVSGRKRRCAGSSTCQPFITFRMAVAEPGVDAGWPGSAASAAGISAGLRTADPGQVCSQARLCSSWPRRRGLGQVLALMPPWWAACCCTITG
jgi:hypothetical protein